MHSKTPAVVDSRCSEVYVDLFRLYGWRQVALLTEDGGQNYPAFHAHLKDRFIKEHIEVVYDRKMPRQASYTDAYKVGLQVNNNNGFRVRFGVRRRRRRPPFALGYHQFIIIVAIQDEREKINNNNKII